MNTNNNHTLNAAIERVRELNANGNTNALIRAHMTIEGYKTAIINKAIKEAGCNQIGSGFTVGYYAFLAEKKRSNDEVLDYINGRNGCDETSANTKKHESHYLNIAQLSQAIFNKLEAELQAAKESAKESAKSESRNHDDSPIGKRIKAAYDKLKKAKDDLANGKPIKNTMFHPDKVSMLGDDELTMLYAEFFKSL